MKTGFFSKDFIGHQTVQGPNESFCAASNEQIFFESFRSFRLFNDERVRIGESRTRITEPTRSHPKTSYN